MSLNYFASIVSWSEGNPTFGLTSNRGSIAVFAGMIACGIWASARNWNKSMRLSSPPQGDMERPAYQREPRAGISHKYMVVDDEPIIADTLTHILNFRGYPCISAYDGDEAIDKARQFRPRFILMGIIMPRMNGVSAAICILKEQPECRIVLFSGSRNAAKLLEDARLKGYEFLVFPKPMHPSDLIHKLSEFGFQPESPTV